MNIDPESILTERPWKTPNCPSGIDWESRLVVRGDLLAALLYSPRPLRPLSGLYSELGEVLMLATGVDIVEIRRIGELLERHGDRFRQRVFTDREWSEAGGRIESLAARFAAKEALIKALGIRELTLREIEVVRPERSQPSLRLRGRAAATARALGVRELALSLAHEHQHAIAIVVARRDGDAPAWDGSDDAI